MNFKVFSILIFGIFFIGVSIGYVFGFYSHKYTNNNNLFYISALIMGVGTFLIIYSGLYLNNKVYGNRKENN